MSDDSAITPDVPKVPEVPEPTKPSQPNFAAALILGVILLYNLTLDFLSDTYDGSKLTYALCLGLLFVLGVDISKVISTIFRGRGGP